MEVDEVVRAIAAKCPLSTQSGHSKDGLASCMWAVVIVATTTLGARYRSSQKHDHHAQHGADEIGNEINRLTVMQAAHALRNLHRSAHQHRQSGRPAQ